jgi:glycosyltransferase involved in cell wall biosynthesis
MKPLLDGYPEQPLVSIIIPCYNAERWLSHAILSCLEQTYRPIEIIVIDDGSTDGSLDIIKSYDKALTWETGPNRGGNAARNRGFALSKGAYIQFLDADDYLLPEKIERQVRFLEETGADVVYGDWRKQFHHPDNTITFSEVYRPGAHQDMLQMLLATWLTASFTLLLRRDAFILSGGWDEIIQAMQEQDLYLSLTIAGCRMCYQAGSGGIHRRYGPVTVSTSNPHRLLLSHALILKKAEARLSQANRLLPIYSHALSNTYFWIARGVFNFDPAHAHLIYQHSLRLSATPESKATFFYKSLYKLVGFERANQLANYKRTLAQIIISFLNSLKN